MSDEPKLFKAQLLTPEGALFDGEVKSVHLPGTMGPFKIFYNHAPIVSTMGIGSIQIEPAVEGKKVYAVTGGFAEMNKNVLTILAEKAEEKATIDPVEARTLRDSVKEQMRTTLMGWEKFEVELEIAENRLKIAEL